MAGRSGTLDKVSLALVKVPPVVDQPDVPFPPVINVAIHATDSGGYGNGYPIGSPLGSGTYRGPASATQSTLVDIPLSTTARVDKGLLYAIVVSTPGQAALCFRAEAGSSSNPLLVENLPGAGQQWATPGVTDPNDPFVPLSPTVLFQTWVRTLNGLDYENSRGPNLSCQTYTSSFPRGAKFTAGRTGNLYQVSLILGPGPQPGSVFHPVTVSIEALDANGHPTATRSRGEPTGVPALGSATYSGPPSPDDATYVDVTLTNPAFVTAGTEYAVVVRGSDFFDANCLYVQTGILPRLGVFGDDGAGGWFLSNQATVPLRTWVTAAPAPPLSTVSTFVGSAGAAGSDDGTGSAATLNGPNGMAIDGAGNVYFADTFNHTIRRATPGGEVTTIAGTPGVIGSSDGTGSAATFNYPNSIVLDSSGDLYVADTMNHTIRKVTAAGVVTTVAGSPDAFGSDDGTGSAARFSQPYGIARDGAGNLYVADAFNHTIRKVTTAGVVTTLAGTPGVAGSADGAGSAATFNSPVAVAVDGSGNVFVSDQGNQTIRRVASAGAVTTLAGSPGIAGFADGVGSAARFHNPYGIAVDGSGNLYVAEYINNTVRRITPAGVVTTLAGAAGLTGSADGIGSTARFNNPAGVAVNASATTVYVSDQNNHTIRRII
jgi:sugar lactone lactonase YvrE